MRIIRIALSVLFVVVLSVVLANPGIAEAHSHPSTTWAFCGVDPVDPHAQLIATNLAEHAGIDATFGPCLPPPADYTPAEPGARYADYKAYLHLLVINAKAGMKTVVYDSRLWSDDLATRNAAIQYWHWFTPYIAAFDMGDEFDPASPLWSVLTTRWGIMSTFVTPVLNVRPYTNHLPWVTDQALTDLGTDHYSFDSYTLADATGIAQSMDARTDDLMCAVNTLTHGPYAPTTWSVRHTMHALSVSGCDSFLIFGGVTPYGTDQFGTASLVDANGAPTPLAYTVMVGQL